jgi:hypothetical protein
LVEIIIDDAKPEALRTAEYTMLLFREIADDIEVELNKIDEKRVCGRKHGREVAAKPLETPENYDTPRPHTKASTPRSSALAACHRDEPVCDGLFMQRLRSMMKRSGKIIMVSSVAGTASSVDGMPIMSRESRHYTRYLGPGSRAVWDNSELHRARRDSDRADYGDGHSWQHSEQS